MCLRSAPGNVVLHNLDDHTLSLTYFGNVVFFRWNVAGDTLTLARAVSVVVRSISSRQYLCGHVPFITETRMPLFRRP
jgi:hypothetical protein